jgi:hypothetical protein
MLSVALESNEIGLRDQISLDLVCKNAPALSGHEGIKEKK